MNDKLTEDLGSSSNTRFPGPAEVGWFKTLQGETQALAFCPEASFSQVLGTAACGQGGTDGY